MLSDQFSEYISDDWLWRERELRDADKLLVGKKENQNIKAAILITYSHWEGHFKICATTLLEFLCEGIKKKLFKWTDIKPEVRQRLLFCSYRQSSVSGQTHETFISYLNALNDSRYASAISAKDQIVMIDDNLNFLRAEAICRNLGVDPSWFITKKIIIDERLLAHRNAIAHGAKRLRTGELISTDDPLLRDALNETRFLIRATKVNFMNAISSKAFLS